MNEISDKTIKEILKRLEVLELAAEGTNDVVEGHCECLAILGKRSSSVLGGDPYDKALVGLDNQCRPLVNKTLDAAPGSWSFAFKRMGEEAKHLLLQKMNAIASLRLFRLQVKEREAKKLAAATSYKAGIRKLAGIE